MAVHNVTFLPENRSVEVSTGTLLVEAAEAAGIDLQQPCGGQGRCGRCAVIVKQGTVRRRSTLRLTAADVEAGYALACQTVVEGDCSIDIPVQEKIERRLTTDRTAGEIELPFVYDAAGMQPMSLVHLDLTPPSLNDQTDDWSRLHRAFATQTELADVRIPLGLLRTLGSKLRASEWRVTAVVDRDSWEDSSGPARLVDVWPQDRTACLWGLAVDIGTTTVTAMLVDLEDGTIAAQAADYNGQIARGEDVISRIMYASKREDGYAEMQALVLGTINELIEAVCKRAQASPEAIVKATVAGNSTMIHLLLGIDASSIRLMPFVTAVNHVPSLLAEDVGLAINPLATVDCLPGVASYVGADITAGVLASKVDQTAALTLFMDVGTNGEIVLGNADWLVTCACSAGPAFEGAGVASGMRATRGAIEEVWIHNETYEPTYRVIGNVKPVGMCGSALISLLGELFITGVMDKGGHLNTSLDTPRVREGEHGAEYVVAWASETATGEDVVLTTVDIDNLLRAKAAIYAGFSVLAESVGMSLGDVEQVLIGGNFGKYINVEKAIQIGLLPDMPWERFHFLGNTSIKGALMALLGRSQRDSIADIAAKMTYIELSADNTFFDAFTSALFLPHTDLNRFPTVKALVSGES